MEKIETKKYKTLYPDSMIANNKILYRQTNRNLNSFLKNNFSNSSSTYKFQIKKLNSKIPIKKQITIKKQNTIKKEKPKEKSEKNNIKSLIESLRHENYISYNYYDNTKGPLQSTKHNKKIIKQKSYNIIYKNNKNSINENETNPNSNNYKNFLSLDSRPISPKSNLFNSNSSLSLFNINRKKSKKYKTIIDSNRNSNLNSFSLNKHLTYRRKNLSKNTSIPQSPSSTRYKSNTKRNSLKLEYDSLSFNNSEKKMCRSGSTFSVKNKKLKNDETGETYSSISDSKRGREQRHFHQKLYLHNLRSQIQQFESSIKFPVNESQIQLNLLNPSLFQRDLFVKEIKRASKNNDFFFKKSSEKDKFQSKKSRAQSPHQNICDKKSKNILKNIEYLYKKLNISQNYIKNLDYRIGTNNLKRIFNLAVPVKHNVRDIDDQFKDETINYQKDIGKFFIYKGSGVYSGHINTILRGDKIVKQAIKFDSL